MSKTIRLTAAQALVKYLTAQMNEDNEPFIAGVWAIFGHGNVAGLGEALYAERERLATWRGHNEQTMAHAAIAYSKQLRRKRAMAVTSSIGPGATNMVTAAALAHVNRLPVLLLPGDVFASRGPDPVLQQIEDFGDGTVSANERCWEQLHEGFITLGTCAGPDDVYMVQRGLKTMGIRLERHQQSALELARWLEGQAGVRAVLHPALPSFPGHDLWKRDFGGASGLFSIVLDGGGAAKAHAFLDALRIFGLGYSWGGHESLAVHVWLGDRTVSRKDYGGPVIRLQVGLEDVVDLKADIAAGLEAAGKAG